MFWLKGKIEKNNNFTKGQEKKIKNQNNEDWIEKHNTINLNWKIKLKINKISTKWSRPKIRNQKNNDWSWNINNQ
jgi:hypothetical protein